MQESWRAGKPHDCFVFFCLFFFRAALDELQASFKLMLNYVADSILAYSTGKSSLKTETFTRFRRSKLFASSGLRRLGVVLAEQVRVIETTRLGVRVIETTRLGVPVMETRRSRVSKIYIAVGFPNAFVF